MFGQPATFLDKWAQGSSGLLLCDKIASPPEPQSWGGMDPGCNKNCSSFAHQSQKCFLMQQHWQEKF
jgi:hypothetical protein